MRSNFAGLAVGILMLSTLPGLASTVSSANSKAAPGTTPRFAVTSQPTQLFYSNGAARGGAYTSVTAGSGMSISRTLSAGMAQSAVGSGPLFNDNLYLSNSRGAARRTSVTDLDFSPRRNSLTLLLTGFAAIFGSVLWRILAAVNASRKAATVDHWRAIRPTRSRMNTATASESLSQ